MSAKKKVSTRKTPQEKIQEKIDQKMHQADMESMLTRCRAMTIGSAGGGIVEIIMRSNEGYHTWNHLQPVEVIELIHQLAGQVGCHIAVQPRKDFASWREWNITEEEQKHFGPWPPQPDMRGLMTDTAMKLPPQAEQAGLSPSNLNLGEEDALAIKKAVNGRATKQSRKTS